MAGALSAAEQLSAAQARRIALAAQGFGRRRPTAPGRRHLTETMGRLGVVQIDSVNVVSRTHYLPFFSRLGPYPRDALEDLAWGKRPQFFEYWAHEASLLPLSTQPLLRWRMEDAAEGVGVWKGVARFLRDHPALMERAVAAIGERGPLTASELELGARGAGGWWGWSEAKRAAECLFWTGRLTTATRRATFERVYGLPREVLPRDVHGAPTPSREAAQRDLLRIAARAQGVATERDLRDYFRMGPADTRARIGELVEAGELILVTVRGWDRTAYLDPGAREEVRAPARHLGAEPLVVQHEPGSPGAVAVVTVLGISVLVGPAERRHLGQRDAVAQPAGVVLLVEGRDDDARLVERARVERPGEPDLEPARRQPLLERPPGHRRRP
ncbi:MAG: hypothetical protein B7Z13_09850, partial [Caulobacterales bacterium 32-67-6]